MSNRTKMACSVCYGTGRDVAGKRCPFDCTPASEPAVDRDAERAAFEAWSSEALPGHSIDRYRGSYESYPVVAAWHVWQARAKLATHAAPAVPSPAPMVAKSFEDRMNEAALKPFPFAWRPDLAPQGAQASQDDAKRLMFAMQDIDGFGCIEMDKYDYAIRSMEASKHDEITPVHELQGVRDLIDAAIRATGTDTLQGEV